VEACGCHRITVDKCVETEEIHEEPYLEYKSYCYTSLIDTKINERREEIIVA
jgi:hypothetical protein